MIRAGTNNLIRLEQFSNESSTMIIVFCDKQLGKYLGNIHLDQIYCYACCESTGYEIMYYQNWKYRKSIAKGKMSCLDIWLLYFCEMYF